MEDSPEPQVRPPRDLTPALARELNRPGENRTFWTSLVPSRWLPAAASARRRC